MDRITELTKHDIYNLFKNGITEESIFGTLVTKYQYYGRMEEIEFLKRIYPLKDMESYDDRYQILEEDIYKHTVANDDYEDCWVFNDNRFKLQHGTDECYLKFLCEIFHPMVRTEGWEIFFMRVNSILHKDEYELFPDKVMSEQYSFTWRTICKADELAFSPLSIRNKGKFSKKICISRNNRKLIRTFLERFDNKVTYVTDTNLPYNTSISKCVYEMIKTFYVPKCYDKNGKFAETDDLERFLLFSSPYSVLDVLELWGISIYEKDSIFSFYMYEIECNKLLNKLHIPYVLVRFKLEEGMDSLVVDELIDVPEESGLEELINQSKKYYTEKNLQVAIEKIWDAFERLKTFYKPELDKKNSADKVINVMSGGDIEFNIFLSAEFKFLTDIGNDYRIRHHEKGKKEIPNNAFYEYFYKRCYVLLTTAIKCVNSKK